MNSDIDGRPSGGHEHETGNCTGHSSGIEGVLPRQQARDQNHEQRLQSTHGQCSAEYADQSRQGAKLEPLSFLNVVSQKVRESDAVTEEQYETHENGEVPT